MAAADRLATAGVGSELFEGETEWGGHTRSHERDGFVFDEGPHVSFTKDERVRELFTRGARDVLEFSAQITNYFRTRWVTHPAQCHLYGLDPDLVTACVVDMMRVQQAPPKIEDYGDWCVAMFGKTFAENFPFVYTRKYWTREARELTTDWVGNRMYPPKLEEVVRGALVPDQGGNFHYLSKFRYPARGGYQSFMRAMLRPELLRLGKRVTRLSLSHKQLEFADGSSSHYEHLISTMPIPELIRAIDPTELPSAIRAASEALLCSSLVLVDVAVSRSDLSAHHWFYVYDEDIGFARGHYPHMLSPHNAPPNCGSIQLEIYHSRYKPLTAAVSTLPERTVAELVRMGILRDKSEVRWASSREVPYANVVFDKQRSDALALIQPWLDEHGLTCAGRYGDWAYHWTDDAVKSGWRAADAVLARLGAPTDPPQ